ncbi:hypothetical protein AMJ51_00530 [Microgenomates bacterium DG_75]|nr:MAG: hypothetical protein AMJ51_00530 [Microgenomates bacterium DG_75]
MTKENSIKQPEKKETLARKQKERIRRVRSLRSRLPELPPQWWVGIGEILGLTILFLVNFLLLFHFFGHEDKYNAFSAPVIPVLATLIEKWVPFASGVRIWLLVLFLFFPPSFYFLVREIAGRKLTAFIASFLAILPIGIFLRIRVDLGLLSEDGAHMAALTFIPLVCIFLLRFLKRGNFWAGLLSALGTVLVALTSPICFVVLGVFMGVITFSEMLLGGARLKFSRFLVVLILAVGFSAFWYHPKFIILTLQSSQGQLVKKALANLLPVSFFLVPLLGVFGFLLFENRPQLQPIFVAFFLTIGFGLFSLGAGVTYPVPSRFLPAFGISLAFLLGVLSAGLFDFLRRSPKPKRFRISSSARKVMAWGLISLIFSLITIIIIFSLRNFWELEQTQVLGFTTEQKVGIWEIKEKTTLIENIFGYTITGLTAIGAAILKVKFGL